MSQLGHLQNFPEPKDVAAPPSKAEIGGVTFVKKRAKLKR
jgi:hypothetical protein